MAKAVTLWRISAYYGIGVCTDMFFETGRIEWLAFFKTTVLAAAAAPALAHAAVTADAAAVAAITA